MSAAQRKAALSSADDSVLVVIDIQTAFQRVMPEPDWARLLENTGILLQAAQLLKIPVLATEQYPKGLGRLVDEVAAHLPDSAPLFEKTAFSSCGAAGLMDSLNDLSRGQVVLAGIEAHVCMLQTALELNAAGLEVYVPEDTMCSQDPANKLNAAMRMRQAGVIVSNTQSILFEWLRDAEHAQFKAVTALL